MKGKDVLWEVEPTFAVSRLLGVAPHDQAFVTRKAHLAWTLVSLVACLAFGVYLSLFATQNGELTAFSLILERAQLAIILLTVVVSALKAIANVDTLHGVLSQLRALDRQLYEIGVLVPYSRLYGYMLAAFRLLLIISLCLPDLTDFKSYRDYDYLIVQYNLLMPLLVGNIVQVQFMVLLELVQRRIRILKEKLQDIKRGDNFTKNNHHLHVLVSAHSSLISVCETVNALYSPQILIILSSIFLMTTANLYHVIDKSIAYITKEKGSELNSIGMTTYKVVVRSLEVWTMVTTCVNTQELAKEFNVNLYQEMIDDKANELTENRKLRLHVSMNRDIVFTAGGFFTLDYTLVHSMIAAATTYLVILIQFGQPNSPADGPRAANRTL